MEILDVIENIPSLSMKQLAFFYELCKAGVVRFDMDNPAHAELLGQMDVLMRRSMDKAAYSKHEKVKKETRAMAYAAILCQIVSHIVPAQKGGG